MSNDQVNSLIVGHKGQDGTLLIAQLNHEGASWLGIDRDAVDGMGAAAPFPSETPDVSNPDYVQKVLRQTMPQKIFYLAAHHCSASRRPKSFASYFRSGLAVNVLGPLNFLEAVARYSPRSKFLYVSSSLIYAPGESTGEFITESSRIAPSESYAVEKVMAGCYCREYRASHDVFASVALPFNHESMFRPPGFFTRDATDAIAAIRFGKKDYWEVGDLDTIVDWSYAGDVVTAFRAILDLEAPDDYIISSGSGHSTRDFIKIACDYAGVDFEKSIRLAPNRVVRHKNSRIGDCSKLRAATGWRPTMEFPELVRRLMQAALDRGSRNAHS